MAQAYPSDSYTPAALSARGLVAELVLRREEWLVDRVLGHARAHGYSRFTPASREAWRASVASLSAAVCSALESAHDFELSPEATSPDDPISVYAVLEAGRHRQRGVTLSMFLGLIKYYRDSYLELVEAESFEAPAASEARRLVTRFFDRLEIAFCAEWEAHVGEARVRELQVHNRLLTNEKNKYLTLFESLRDAVVLFDGHGAPEHVNGAALALFGHGRAPAAEDAPDVPVVPAGLHGAVRELLRAGHEQGLFDLALGTREGRRELEVGLHRMPDVGGRCEGVVAVLRDVTERRRSELELHRYRAGLEALVIERAHALSESETRYRQLFDLGPDGVLVLRGERVELCNAAAAELAGGASPRELVGRRIFDFLGPPDDVVVAERIAAATASTGLPSTPFKVRLRRLDGRLADVELMAAVLPGPEGRLLVFLRDLGDRIRAGQALLRNARLEATATMARGIAHDFNNLMTVILASTDLLSDSLGGDAETAFIIEEVERAARRAGELATQMLVFAGDTVAAARELDVAQLIRDALRLSHAFAPPGVAVREQVSAGLWGVAGDAGQLVEALLCLFRNAFEAIAEQGAVVARARNVMLEESPGGGATAGPYVVVSVEDNGVGMSEEVVARIFEPFFTTKFPGRGLGLAVVYGTVERLHGRVVVKSEEGRGTTVELWLPARLQRASQIAQID